MAVTLVEAAKRNNGDVFRSAIIQIYAQSHMLMSMIPFEDIPGNSLSYNQEDTPGGIAFRGVNEGYVEDAGIINPETERLVIAGGDMDVDKFIIKTMGQDQRTVREAMKIKRMAHYWAHTFIKGDATSDPKSFDGMQVRVSGNQLIDNGASSGGDALSLTKLDELIDAVDDATHLLMNKQMRRYLTAAARDNSVGGNIWHTRDMFGRQLTMYGDLPIITMDNNDHIYKTLQFDEANPGGGSNVGTSIYACAFREGMLTGIQNGDMDATDIGELQTKPAMRTRIEWYSGVAVLHPRSVARLRGIKSAAVVK